MNRRNFLAVAGAVLSAPIAAVNGWFEGRLESPELPVDARRFYDLCHCELCGNGGRTDTYYGETDGESTVIVDLCDPCAESQGFLCERRNWPHVDVFDDPGWVACHCGKRGCPGIEELRQTYNEAMKPGFLSKWLAEQRGHGPKGIS